MSSRRSGASDGRAERLFVLHELAISVLRPRARRDGDVVIARDFVVVPHPEHLAP